MGLDSDLWRVRVSFFIFMDGTGGTLFDRRACHESGANEITLIGVQNTTRFRFWRLVYSSVDRPIEQASPSR